MLSRSDSRGDRDVDPDSEASRVEHDGTLAATQLERPFTRQGYTTERARRARAHVHEGRAREWIVGKLAGLHRGLGATDHPVACAPRVDDGSPRTKAVVMEPQCPMVCRRKLDFDLDGRHRLVTDTTETSVALTGPCTVRLLTGESLGFDLLAHQRGEIAAGAVNHSITPARADDTAMRRST